MLRNLNQSFSGRRILGIPQVGVPASAIPATGDNGAALLYNDISAGDPVGCLYRVWMTSDISPSGPTLLTYEDSSWVLTGAADGVTYTVGERNDKYDPTTGLFSSDTTTGVFQVGTVSTGATVTLSGIAALAAVGALAGSAGGGVSVILQSESVTAYAGVLSAGVGAVTTLQGIAVAGAVGVLTIPINSTTLAGVQAAGAVGALIASAGVSGATLLLTEDMICKAVRSYIKTIAPADMRVLRTPANKASMPDGPFVAFTPGMMRPLSTNLSVNVMGSQRSVVQNEQMSFMISCYGLGAGDLARTLNALFRDPFAVECFAGTGLEVTPLYAGDVMQAPFVNDANQYEDQYTFEIELQVKPVIVVPLQSCNILDVNTRSVDAHYPPTEV